MATRRRSASADTGRAGPPVKIRSRETEALLARVRPICLRHPGAIEKLSHGEPTWFAGKVFAMFDDHHHGSAHVALWLPAPLGEQAARIAADPHRYFRPPYVGHKGWLGVVLDAEVDWDEVAALVGAAFAEVTPPPRRR